MTLSFISTGKGGKSDTLFVGLAKAAKARELKICGTLQITHAVAGHEYCDIDVELLPDGPTLRISQNLGDGAKGCRLDAAVLERAVLAVQNGIRDGADLLIINRFGRHESEGRGFREIIAEALGDEIPVIVGVNPLYREAFLEFAGEVAEELTPETTALTRWLDSVAKPDN